MPGRTAKITLQADISGLQRQVDEAKRILSGVSTGEAFPERPFQKTTFTQAKESIDDIKVKMGEVRSELAAMGRESGGVFDPGRVRELTRELTKLKRGLDEVSSSMGRVGAAGIGGGGGGMGYGRTGAGLTGIPIVGRAFRPIATTNPLLRLLAPFAGAAAGLVAVRNAMRVATETRQLRGLTGIGADEPVESLGPYGFMPTERRTRGLDIVQAFGSRMNQGQLESGIRQSEMIERAFGVGGQTQAGLLAAGRRAGVTDMTPRAVSQAVAAGLTGSRMIEYLEAMTESLSSLSEGVNIDDRSIASLGGVFIANSEFFRQDARRVSRTFQGLNEMFAGGDRFQQAQAFRAIRRTAGPGASAAGVEIRRRLGLFANLSSENLEYFGGGGPRGGPMGSPNTAFGNVLGVGGTDIIQNIMEEITSNVAGLGPAQQAFEFMSRIGMMNEGGLSLFRLQKQGKLTTEALQGVLKETPEAIRLEADKAMQSIPAKLEDVAASFSSVGDDIARLIADPLTKFSDSIRDFAGTVDIFAEIKLDDTIKSLREFSDSFNTAIENYNRYTDDISVGWGVVFKKMETWWDGIENWYDRKVLGIVPAPEVPGGAGSMDINARTGKNMMLGREPYGFKLGFGQVRYDPIRSQEDIRIIKEGMEKIDLPMNIPRGGRTGYVKMDPGDRPGGLLEGVARGSVTAGEITDVVIDKLEVFWNGMIKALKDNTRVTDDNTRVQGSMLPGAKSYQINARD